MMRITSLLAVALLFSCTNPTIDNSQSTQLIFLVRHAEKVADGTGDPELTREGIVRANKLAEMLATAEINKIFSTNYKRTVNTGLPISKLLNLEINMYDPHNESELSRMLESVNSGNMLIIGHSNTIPGLVNGLIGQEKYLDLDNDEYDKLFMVTRIGENSLVTVLTY